MRLIMIQLLAKYQNDRSNCQVTKKENDVREHAKPINLWPKKVVAAITYIIKA